MLRSDRSPAGRPGTASGSWVERLARSRPPRRTLAAGATPESGARSLAERVRRETSRAYYIRSTPADGRPAWFFLAVSPGKDAAFHRALAGRTVLDLADFGRVVKSGFGVSAPEPVKREMAERYGIEYD